MNTTSFQPHPNHESSIKVPPPSPQNADLLSPLTITDLTGDIELVISRIVSPFIDHTSYALNAEDLRAECRAKLARIISEGHLAKCPTRAKAFAFVKASLSNHVRSLIQKYAYAMKRTGRVPGSIQTDWVSPKPIHIRIDDPDIDFQLGTEDKGARICEMLEELSCHLSTLEMAMLNNLISKRAGSPDSFSPPRDDWRSGSQGVREARKRLLQKCRAILAGLD